MLKLELFLFIVLWMSLGASVIYRDALIEIYPFYIPSAFLFLAYIARIIKRGWLPRIRSGLSVMIILFLLSILIALPFSQNPSISLSYTIYLMICFFLFYYTYQNTDIIPEKVMYRLLFIFSLMQGVFGLLQVITGTTIGVIAGYFGEVKEVGRGAIFGLRRAMGTFDNPNRYTQFMTLFSSYAVSIFMKRNSIRNLIYIVFCISSVLISFSTGSWIAVALLLLQAIFITIWKERRFQTLYRLIFALAMLGVIAIFIFSLLDLNPAEITILRIEYKGEWLSNNLGTRLRSIFEAFISSTELFFGTGFNMFQVVFPDVSLVRPHNAFLLFLAEVGWLPTILIIIVGLILLQRMIIISKRHQLNRIQNTAILFLPALLFFFMVYLTALQRETLAAYSILYGYTLGLTRNNCSRETT